MARFPSKFSITSTSLPLLDGNSIEKSKHSETPTYILETLFLFFEHPKWKLFFNLLRPKCTTPAPDVIEILMDETCKRKMSQRLEVFKFCNDKIMGTDGTTNDLLESIRSVIFRTPIPFFLVYLRSDL